MSQPRRSNSSALRRERRWTISESIPKRRQQGKVVAQTSSLHNGALPQLTYAPSVSQLPILHRRALGASYDPVATVIESSALLCAEIA